MFRFVRKKMVGITTPLRSSPGIEEAKRRLERTDDPIEEISWAVGYEDPAFFRRLFRRIARLTPGDYRRKFRMPELPGIGDADACS